MKMRKLLSIGALTLAIVSCTTIGASAAEVSGKENKRQAMRDMVTNVLEDGKVFYNADVKATTPVGDYLTDKFIEETNDFLEDNDLNVYFENESVKWSITKDDDLYAIQKNIVKTLKSLDKEAKDTAVYSIKEYLLSKLEEFEAASKGSDDKLKEIINEYFNTEKYGVLTVGRNMDNAKTVTLTKNGKIVAQVNTNNVYKVVDKLNEVKNYDDLKALILEYYPEILEYYPDAEK